MLNAKKYALESKNALLQGDVGKLAQLLHKNWEEKKHYSRLVSTPVIDNFYDSMREHGIWGGKLLGAGGGGYMLLLVPPQEKMQLIRKAQELGAQYVDFNITFDGLIVREA